MTCDHQPLVQVRPVRLEHIFPVLQPPQERKDPVGQERPDQDRTDGEAADQVQLSTLANV